MRPALAACAGLVGLGFGAFLAVLAGFAGGAVDGVVVATAGASAAATADVDVGVKEFRIGLSP